VIPREGGTTSLLGITARLLAIILISEADFNCVVLGTTDLSSESAVDWQIASQLKDECYMPRGTRKAYSIQTDELTSYLPGSKRIREAKYAAVVKDARSTWSNRVLYFG
jgi:hypothetical protein